MRLEAFVAACLVSALAGCTGSPPAMTSTTAADGIGLEVRVTAAGLELTNRDSAPVYYRAIDPMSLALSDRVPCLTPDPCPVVAGLSQVMVPLEDAIVGYRPDTERATVYWWHMFQRPDGSYGSDEVRTLEVTF